MQIADTEIPGIMIVQPGRHDDERGWLSELWNPQTLAACGVDAAFAQDNLTYSGAAGVVRALHFQAPPHDQGKLVTCVTGAVFDVVVDIRAGSPTWGRHVAVELSAENGRQIWAPSGFAHGYCTLTPDTRVLYKLTAPYRLDAMGGLLWCDPALGIDWPVATDTAVVNARDAAWPGLDALESPFAWEA